LPSSGRGCSRRATAVRAAFWIGLAWCILAGLVLAVGIPLSFILIGIPLLILGKAMLALGAVWYGLRCVVGVIHLAQGDAYPRPYALLV